MFHFPNSGGGGWIASCGASHRHHHPRPDSPARSFVRSFARSCVPRIYMYYIVNPNESEARPPIRSAFALDEDRMKDFPSQLPQGKNFHSPFSTHPPPRQQYSTVPAALPAITLVKDRGR